MLPFGKSSDQELESPEGRRHISSLQMSPIFCQNVISTLFEYRSEADTASR